MTTVLCHTMVTEDNQSCLLVHFFDNLLDYAFYVMHFTLKLWVLGVVCMASVIHTNEMCDKELEVRAVV